MQIKITKRSNNKDENHLPMLFNFGINKNSIVPSLPALSNIRNYFEEGMNESNERNSGHIKNVKSHRNMRILSSNPHRCRPYDN